MGPRKDAGQGDTAVRERLMLAATELFKEKGYAGASVREIVAAAGVTKPVLYYYFGNKEGLYLELMTGTFRTFQGIVSQVATFPGTVRERIIRFSTTIFDSFVENISVVRLIYSIFFGPPQGAPMFSHDQYYTTMLELIAGLLQEGIDAGELRSVDVHVVTWTIISCMNTVMEEQLCNDPPRIDRDGLQRMLGLVLDSVAAGGGDE